MFFGGTYKQTRDEVVAKALNHSQSFIFFVFTFLYLNLQDSAYSADDGKVKILENKRSTCASYCAEQTAADSFPFAVVFNRRSSFQSTVLLYIITSDI